MLLRMGARCDPADIPEEALKRAAASPGRRVDEELLEELEKSMPSLGGRIAELRAVEAQERAQRQMDVDGEEEDDEEDGEEDDDFDDDAAGDGSYGSEMSMEEEEEEEDEEEDAMMSEDEGEGGALPGP